MPASLLIAPVSFAVYVALELLVGRFRSPLGSRRESWLDVAAWAKSWFLVAPTIVTGSLLVGNWLLPHGREAWAATSWWLQFVIFVVLEDMGQYWYHRSCHAFPALWGLHKVHHAAPYMGVRIIWRNSLFYELLMPNLWVASLLVYMGFGSVYAWYSLLKITVTMGAHSELRWDAFLYRHRWLAPVAWVVERTISTPATHFAHHAATEDDGVGHYHGNFGNLLFFWDVIFGTALITRKYPARFGLELAPGEKPDPWYVLIFYPLARARAVQSDTADATRRDASIS
jgi:sterol desaturase/sphingolipid hydroxylase (fatty acid hydroxylase superfamily)